MIYCIHGNFALCKFRGFHCHLWISENLIRENLLICTIIKIRIIYHFPTGIHQLLTCHSQQYINYHCEKSLFYCYSFCVCNSTISFQHKGNLFPFHFQTKDSNMYVYAHSWSPNDGNRNQQNSQLLSLFLLQHALVLVSNPIHQYNIFLLASFF